MSDVTPTAMRCDAITVTNAAEPAVALLAAAPDGDGGERTIDDVRGYIDRIDFADARTKMAAPDECGWPADRIERAEALYKRWLFLRAKHRDELMPPTADIDEFWHRHILDSSSYFRDCQAIFGGYFHHFPYFGTRGPEDERLLQEAFRNTLRRYREEYGEDLPASEPAPRL